MLSLERSVEEGRLFRRYYCGSVSAKESDWAQLRFVLASQDWKKVCGSCRNITLVEPLIFIQVLKKYIRAKKWKYVDYPKNRNNLDC